MNSNESLADFPTDNHLMQGINAGSGQESYCFKDFSRGSLGSAKVLKVQQSP